MESVLYHVNDGVIIMTMKGEILHFNWKCEELLELTEQNILNHSILEVFADLPLEQYRRLKSGECKNRIIKVRDKNLAVTASLFMLDNTDMQLILTLQDVSEIQQMERHILIPWQRRD